MKTLIHLCTVALVLLSCGECVASVPGMMSYQGKLTDSNGQPVSDGLHNMTFGLYAAATGGTALWTETKSVQVTGGVFSVLLGSTVEIPNSAFPGTTWLETQVDGSVMTPRTRIVNAGYAMLAATAETVLDGSITSAKIAPSAVSSSTIADASVSTADLATASVTEPKLANNSVTSWKMTPFSVINSKIGPGAVTLDKLASNIKLVFDVTEYGAAGNGTTDDTTAFQNALNAASAAGGGIVWVPVGNYKIATHLDIPARVTLEGVHRAVPRDASGSTSTLLAYEGSGNENGTPFIFMNANSTLKGISVLYPSQSTTAPVAYPWCVRGSGDNCSIVDVLLCNPWNAVDFGTNASGRHYIKSLYGQPLHTGIFVDQCYDVGRIQDVHFWPFWTEGLVTYTQQNATAIKFGRTDWEYVTNCFVLGYKIGYHFVRTATGNCNGTFLGIGSDGSDVAVQVDSAAPFGLLITNGEFVANYGASSVGMYVGADGGSVSLTNCAFWGASNRIATIDGGSVKFNSCNFMDWDRNSTGEYAIVANGGRLTVQGSTFVDNKNRVRVASGVTAAIVVANQGMSNSEISNSIGAKCTVANNQH
ncbi:MAG: glycosyl hydrolase family 28-related protein [Armatimonadota bacterium]|nr:glycosyl hydrolase family 28-related protein [Armatimonadota bacterium]